MILILKEIHNGFILELKIYHQIKILNSILLILESLTLCLIMACFLVFIHLKNKRKLGKVGLEKDKK